MLGVPRKLFETFLLSLAMLGASIGQYYLTIAPELSVASLGWIAAGALFLVYHRFSREDVRCTFRGAVFSNFFNSRFAILAICLVSIFFVCFRIGTFPPGLNHDAAWEGLYALRILKGEPYTPYTPEAWGRETLTFYLRALSIWLLGPSVLAIQLPGMILGVLTVPFFFLWMRLMFGGRFAFLAALFLAVSGWHLVFSRTGWRSDFQPFFMVVTCYFFSKGILKFKQIDFSIAGVFLGLTLHCYNGARAFPLVFVFYSLLYRFFNESGRRKWRSYLCGFLNLTLSCSIVAAPLIWYAFNNWDEFMGRASALRNASTLSEAIKASLLLFNYRGNGDDFFIGEPALEYLPAIFFVFGILFGFTKIKDSRIQFLLTGLIVNLLPGLLSKPNLNRDIGTMIFVYPFVGLGAMLFLHQCQSIIPRYKNGASYLIVLFIVGLAALSSYQQYLGNNRRSIWGYYPETTVLGRYMKTLPPQSEIWIGGDNFPRDTLTYLTYDGSDEPMTRNYTWVDDIESLIKLPQIEFTGSCRAFILGVQQQQSREIFDILKERYPGGKVVDLHYPIETGPIFAQALLISTND